MDLFLFFILTTIKKKKSPGSSKLQIYVPLSKTLQPLSSYSHWYRNSSIGAAYELVSEAIDCELFPRCTLDRFSFKYEEKERTSSA